MRKRWANAARLYIFCCKAGLAVVSSTTVRLMEWRARVKVNHYAPMRTVRLVPDASGRVTE